MLCKYFQQCIQPNSVLELGSFINEVANLPKQANLNMNSIQFFEMWVIQFTLRCESIIYNIGVALLCKVYI